MITTRPERGGIREGLYPKSNKILPHGTRDKIPKIQQEPATTEPVTTYPGSNKNLPPRNLRRNIQDPTRACHHRQLRLYLQIVLSVYRIIRKSFHL